MPRLFTLYFSRTAAAALRSNHQKTENPGDDASIPAGCEIAIIEKFIIAVFLLRERHGARKLRAQQ